MAWTDKELKRRTARAARETTSGAGTSTSTHKSGWSETDLDANRVSTLWDKFEAANKALPPGLQLQPQLNKPDDAVPGKPPFRQWLRAPNGAGLGFNGEGIRYYWPQTNKSKSNNFWIRWEAGLGYVVCRRVGLSASSPKTQKLSFKESRVEHMLKCLVTGVRIKPRAIRVRRFWFF